jgi:translation elongation factor EF-4
VRWANAMQTELTRTEEVLPKQLFELSIQAAIGGKVVARETWVMQAEVSEWC